MNEAIVSISAVLALAGATLAWRAARAIMAQGDALGEVGALLAHGVPTAASACAILPCGAVGDGAAVHVALGAALGVAAMELVLVGAFVASARSAPTRYDDLMPGKPWKSRARGARSVDATPT